MKASAEVTLTKVNDGVSVKAMQITYGVSNSQSEKPESFTEEKPEIEEGQFLWTATTTTYSDNKKVTSYQISNINSDALATISSPTPPKNPKEGTWWNDTSQEPSVPKEYKRGKWVIRMFDATYITANTLTADKIKGTIDADKISVKNGDSQSTASLTATLDGLHSDITSTEGNVSRYAQTVYGVSTLLSDPNGKLYSSLSTAMGNTSYFQGLGSNSIMQATSDMISQSVNVINKLHNTEFTPDLQGWQILDKDDKVTTLDSGLVKVVNSDQYNQSNVIELQGTKDAPVTFLQDIPLIAGRKVQATMLVKGDQKYGASRYLRLNYSDGSSSKIIMTYAGQGDPSVDDWNKYSCSTTPKEGVTTGTFVLSARKSPLRLAQPSVTFTEKSVPYSPGIYGQSTEATLKLFKDNFSLGINDAMGQIIAGINGAPDGQLNIKGSAIHIDGDTSVTGNFLTRLMDVQDATIGKSLTINPGGAVKGSAFNLDDKTFNFRSTDVKLSRKSPQVSDPVIDSTGIFTIGSDTGIRFAGSSVTKYPSLNGGPAWQFTSDFEARYVNESINLLNRNFSHIKDKSYFEYSDIMPGRITFKDNGSRSATVGMDGLITSGNVTANKGYFQELAVNNGGIGFNNGSNAFYLYSTSSKKVDVHAGRFLGDSFESLKTNITDVPTSELLEEVRKSLVYRYNFKGDRETDTNVSVVIPDEGGDYYTTEEFISKDDNGNAQGVNLPTMIGYSMGAIQEIDKRMSAQQKDIDMLKEQVAELMKHK